MLKSVALEALLVAVTGVTLALLANALSPRGLELRTNYFPATVSAPPSSQAVAVPASAITGTAAARPAENSAVAERLRQRGLKSIRHEEVFALVQNGSIAEGSVVLVDARGDQPYAANHIPGAWQFHHYRAELFLPALLPRCLSATKVIVYCTGGDCEDSEFAAVMLREAGVPYENLFVYTGGMQEWTREKSPVEAGPRREP